MGALAFFDPADAAVLVAIVSAIAGPMLLLWFQGRKTQQAAAQAVHNTQSNGVPRPDGEPSRPSPYDDLVASHERIVGRLEQIADETRAAATAAHLARAAVKQTDIATQALAKRVDEGFIEAKNERGRLGAALDANVAGGREFAELVGAAGIGVLKRLDGLDGGQTAEALQAWLVERGLSPPELLAPPPPDVEMGKD